jgi:Uricase
VCPKLSVLQHPGLALWIEATRLKLFGSMPSLAAARYGKDNVRVCKVHRDEKAGTHTVTEMTVCVLLEGAIEESYGLHFKQL